jgi:hypothetical protein
VLGNAHYVPLNDVRAVRHDDVVPANRAEIALTGHSVAGLIDAEASFGISEINGGRNLRSWAAAESGALSAVAYQRARRDDWPSRNTLARRFGSWYDAMAAAGLRDRAVMPPAVRDKRTAGGAPARKQNRQAQRERVIDAIRRCAAALGQLPGPTEDARWRFHNDPGAPTFVTAYRLFPGGWNEVQTRVEDALRRNTRSDDGLALAGYQAVVPRRK